jgi:hypothetical protein
VALIAIAGPVLFIFIGLREAELVRQHGGHISFPGAVGGSVLVLSFATVFAFVAFLLL